MPVQQTIPYKEGTFFITFTCYNWISLISISDSYALIYKWFDYLKSKGHKIYGYVIMPNHVHVLIGFADQHQLINTIIGNGKRFIAYDIIQGLKKQNRSEVLKLLSNNIETARKMKKKLHNVWELSFDWKYCNSETFITQKLNYMHDNPCKGKWSLCASPVDYIHSSAKQYIEGEKVGYILDDL